MLEHISSILIVYLVKEKANLITFYIVRSIPQYHLYI